jgi:DsbC/DsbD-like thiol-disulfide interchange protein
MYQQERVIFVLVPALVCWLIAGMAHAGAQTVASPFVDHHERAKSRLLAARHDGKLYAFVEIAMPDGWKTYWRNPGDAGGLPPTFDFSKSSNVTAAQVRYPAPKRLTDSAGDTIGYKGRALFPVEIAAAAADQPVHLKLAANFGVCRDICVPVDATHDLIVAPGVAGEADAWLVAAIAAVPKPAGSAAATLVEAKAIMGDTPHIQFELSLPDADGSDADLFVEAPDGLYVPMVKRVDAAAAGRVRFTSAFASEAELKQVIGQRLKVTLVGKAGGIETDVTVAP